MGKELKCIHGYFKKPHAKGPEYPFVKAVLLRHTDESVGELWIGSRLCISIVAMKGSRYLRTAVEKLLRGGRSFTRI